jgi:KAP family P-loop domain/TIR domain
MAVEPVAATETTSISSSPTSDTPVDAFILFNEREEAVGAIVEQLSARGISTYFWRRDIPAGEAWEEVETGHLVTASAVVVFLGSHGWGPNHLRLAVEAQNLKKRILPVLIGDPPTAALAEAEGMFQRLLYIDLRNASEAALIALKEAIRPDTGTGQFDYIINVLVDGNEEQRSEILQRIVSGVGISRYGLSNRLREEIQQRFSPEQERRFAAAVRDPKKMPSARSWMLSALIGTDPEPLPNRVLILRHLDSNYEPERNVRFWALTGLLQHKVSYLGGASEICLSDPEPEVKWLAEIIRRPNDPQLIATFRSMLSSENFESEAWPVLRILRVLPINELIKDLCEAMQRSAGGTPLAYDALYALANPSAVPAAVPMLRSMYGVGRVVETVIAVARNSDRGSIRNFARLLAGFEAPELTASFATGGQQHPDASDTIRDLRRYVREHRRYQAAPESFVPGYVPDVVDVTRDDLDIREDVQTLTAIMLAKEVVPPLAIGLFGDWGSGKSFFMKSMTAATRRFSDKAKANTSSKFCSQIVSIEFNAWHYADTNLWASLVTHILESLAGYVNPHQTPEAQQNSLIRELNSAKEAVSQIEGERRDTEAQIAARQSELQAIQLEREQKEIELRDLRLTDLQSLFEKEPALKQQLKDALADLGVPSALNTLSDLGAAISEVNSLRGRATALLVGLFKGQNRGVVIALTCTVLALPFLGAWIYHQVSNSFVLIGTIVAEITTFVGGAVGFLRKAGTYAAQQLDRVEAVRRRVDQALAERRRTPSPEEADLQKTIVTLKASEEQVASRLRAATQKVIELEQQMSTLTESRSLSRFLAERTASDDYRKHLGLISIIRRDFETLTTRLANPTTGPDALRVERIILYIDDLDRCPNDKVVDVLQAVHLLLAYPLFVVVVGVDPRWLSHALTSTYSAFRDRPLLADEDADGWQTTPQNYLEKIFQIPSVCVR